MRMGSKVLCSALSLVLTGCGTINTVFRPDAVTSQNLKDSRSHCENVPRIYSGVIYGFCTLNGEPAPDKSLKDKSLIDHDGSMLPFVAVEFVASGVLDTLVLPYTVYRQSRDGSIEIFR
ncbi:MULTISPECIES: YceK/YidQ family lipoprotein [unclassified Pseudomonas]|uniref:YceK/YidQ family lipoprotein n=1 Tax=unclassified Pseudomonas TaxID=196821 RepID=UPI0008CE15EB|nr:MULTISPECIES: YceK/YidQ family lipoprotein [unclassified Pseudomonas]PMV27464.1 YceK/YidQ family lipoprotein [Pseudomonas sp. FW305-3-2-15-C-TSA2]PMV32719.1 YceK/YidQ family lipoprotein [Pseudomonas sp. DP16D-L5]PMV42433.1 YceK/YidQ family lipoprotein [Pseudomonas sp. FW305-3-2-15-A-LB2]PMV49528.1 YceK/YidQ family lipoprotein [Pseudomonas sp. FW305-3-2-15-C-R2A1]PMV55357.1 YceK/YidQ family lipoprotein [Pseudomonas sp. FW305-3-2-15-C-LB1]